MTIIIALDSFFFCCYSTFIQERIHCFARWIMKTIFNLPIYNILNWHYNVYAFLENAVGKFHKSTYLKSGVSGYGSQLFEWHIHNNLVGFVYNRNFPLWFLFFYLKLSNLRSHLSASVAVPRFFALHIKFT